MHIDCESNITSTTANSNVSSTCLPVLIHAIAVTCELEQVLFTMGEQSISLFSDPEQAEVLDQVCAPDPAMNLEEKDSKDVNYYDVLTCTYSAVLGCSYRM